MSELRPAAAKVNLTELLENSAVGPLQIRVFALCMICLMAFGPKVSPRLC